MITVGSDPLHDEMFRKDRLLFTELFASAIRSCGLPDDIIVHLPSIMTNEELQIFQSSIGSKGVYAHGKYAVQIRTASVPEHSCLRLFLFMTHGNYRSHSLQVMTIVPDPPKYRHSYSSQNLISYIPLRPSDLQTKSH